MRPLATADVSSQVDNENLSHEIRDALNSLVHILISSRLVTWHCKVTVTVLL